MSHDEEQENAVVLINKQLKETIDLASDVIRRYFEDERSPKHAFRPSVDEMPQGIFILWNRHDQDHGNWEIIGTSLNGKLPASAFRHASEVERQVLVEAENVLAVFRKRLRVLQDALKTLE